MKYHVPCGTVMPFKDPELAAAHARRCATCRGQAGAPIRPNLPGRVATVLAHSLLGDGGTFEVTADGHVYPVMFAEGWQVGVGTNDTCTVQHPSQLEDTIHDLIRRCVARAKLTGRPAHFGTWANEGHWYAEESAHVSARETARRMGRAYQQIAVWDWAAGASVKVEDL